jgi:branched-chain amino acid transport system permease protein
MKYKQILLVTAIILVILVAISYYAAITQSSTIFQVLFNSVFTGAIYGLLAVGLALIFGVMKVINICHGEFVLLGAYTAFWLYVLLGLSPFISIFLAFPVLFCIGLLISKGLINRALKYGMDQPLLIAFGLSLCLQNLIKIFWTATPRAIITSFGTLSIYGVTFPVLYLLMICVTAFMLFALGLFLTKTHIGRAIRAVAMDAEAASLMGVNPDRINMFSYALGAALAAVTGTLIAMIYPFDPASGSMYINRAFASIVLGGIGYIPGAFIGGIILGTAEGISSLFLGDAVRNGVSYLLFLIILIFKPSGLFSKYRTF